MLVIRMFLAYWQGGALQGMYFTCCTADGDTQGLMEHDNQAAVAHFAHAVLHMQAQLIPHSDTSYSVSSDSQCGDDVAELAGMSSGELLLRTIFDEPNAAYIDEDADCK
jgi:hypothetical protein